MREQSKRQSLSPHGYTEAKGSRMGRKRFIPINVGNGNGRKSNGQDDLEVVAPSWSELQPRIASWFISRAPDPNGMAIDEIEAFLALAREQFPDGLLPKAVDAKVCRRYMECGAKQRHRTMRNVGQPRRRVLQPA